jgi:hypothetical protein
MRYSPTGMETGGLLVDPHPERKPSAAHTLADLDARIAQIDSAIAEATRRGRTNAALPAMEGQRRTRAGLASEREQAAGPWPA